MEDAIVIMSSMDVIKQLSENAELVGFIVGDDSIVFIIRNEDPDYIKTVKCPDRIYHGGMMYDYSVKTNMHQKTNTDAFDYTGISTIAYIAENNVKNIDPMHIATNIAYFTKEMCQHMLQEYNKKVGI